MDTTQIYISADLRKVLEEIQDNSVIARLILQGTHLKGDLPENHINYLSISEVDSSKISYLASDKFLRMIKGGRDVWGSAGRVFGRPGSVVSKLFNLDGSRDVELFNNLYKAALSKVKYEFKIVSGDDIKKYYHQDSYYSSSGSLGNSCMKYDNCQRFFTLYTSNPTIITMLVMFDPSGSIMGRALLWNFDSYKIMDRIYTVHDEELSYQFKKWAIENGYMYKHEQKWNTTLQFELSGKKFEQKFAITLPNWNCEKYPYLDTFKFLDKDLGTLYNYIPHSGVRTLSAPDGSTFDGNVYCFDFLTNILHHHGETINIRYVDGKIQDTELRTLSSNVEWSNVNEMHILKRDAIFSEDHDDYIFGPELDNLNDKKKLEDRVAYLAERKAKLNSQRFKMPTEWSWEPIGYDVYGENNDPQVTNEPAVEMVRRLGRLGGGLRRHIRGVANPDPISDQETPPPFESEFGLIYDEIANGSC